MSDRVVALSDAFRAFAEVTTDYVALLATVARKLTDLIGDGCIVALADDEGRWLENGVAFASDERATALVQEAVRRAPAEERVGMAAKVVHSGEHVLIPEIDPEELAARAQPGFGAAARALGMRSFLSVPLEVRGRRLGALSLFRYLPDTPPFDEQDRAFASSIGDHAALAISNAQLFASLQDELAQRLVAEEKAKTFVALIENSTDFIAMADFAGNVLFVNAAGRRMCGIAADADVAQMKLTDFHTEDGLKRGPVIRETGSWQGEGVLKHFITGELIPTQVSSFLARDTDGRPLCFATVQYDLRQTKRLEAELRQAQKMEALGRLAGGVAHDFNNLLTVILSYSTMLARTLPPESRAADDLEQIERAGLRAADLTKQLLAFSRRQVLEPTALDLATTVRAMEGLIRPLIGEDIELRIVSTDEPTIVMADAGQIGQVVMNLVINARDAMQRGGLLLLEIGRTQLADGPYVTLAVADTGAGIDDETRAHIFDPFFTTKDRGKGTGLGLSTVMGIVEQSGGHITVDSQLGRGTTFRVHLPPCVRPPRAQIVPRTATPMPHAGRILLVEDQPEVRKLVADVLRQAGYDVLSAEDGAAALRLVAASTADIHLLLTDVIMPNMSGRELAARFLELRPATRVLYMSGYTDDKLGHHGVLDPDVALIQKPLTPELLLRRVREILTTS